MVSRLWILLLTVALLGLGAVAAQEIIVESDGPASQPGTFSIHSGSWSSSSGKSEASGLTSGVGSRFIPGGRDGTVIFRIDIPTSGEYEVFATWCTSGNSTDVAYNINHAGGESVVSIVQDGWGGRGDANANEWVSLGSFQFTAGGPAGVAITSQTGTTPPGPNGIHRVYADAVRLVGRSGAAARPQPTTSFFSGTQSQRSGSTSQVAAAPRSSGPAPSVSAQDLIVEANVSTPGAGSFRILNGRWSDSVGKSLAAGLSHDEATQFLADAREGVGVFEFNIPAAGTYDAYATWCTSGNSTDAIYTIAHADGESPVSVTQDGWGAGGASNANTWVPLGTFRFDTSGQSSVSVSTVSTATAPDTRNSHRVYADAIRLVPQTITGPRVASVPVQTRRPDPEPLLASTAVSWRNGLEMARSESRRTGKPVVIYAYTSRSRTCRDNETGLLRDSQVAAALNNAIPVRVNLGENTALAPELRIYRVPTIIVTGGYGEEIDRHVGPITEREMIDLVGSR